MSEETLAVQPDSADEGRLGEAHRVRLVVVLVSIVLLSESTAFTYALAVVLTPLVGHAFPASGNSVSWMLTIVGVVGGATIALLTKAGDLWGKKRVMLWASVVFAIGTLICALTTSWPLFLAGRGLEGAAVGLSAVAYGLVRDVMPRSWIPVTIGFLGSGLGVAVVGAPLIGGLLAETYSWRSLFWFMVGYMVVAIPLFALAVPESRVRVKQRLDILGVVLIGAGLTGVLLYLSEGSSWGWSSPGNLGSLAGGLVLLAAFIWWEGRISYPAIELRLLRSRNLSQLLALTFFFTAAYTGPAYAASYMFQIGKQQVEGGVLAAAAAQTHTPLSVLAKAITFRGNIGYAPGFDLFQYALHVLLWGSLATIILGPAAGAWSRRIGARRPLLAGLAVELIGLVGLVIWHGDWLQYAIFFVLVNIAAGLFYGTAPNILLDVVPAGQQGISGGIYTGIGPVASAFMSAIMTSILVRFSFQTVAVTPKGTVVSDIPQVYTATGYGWVFVVCAVAAVIAMVFAVLIKAGRKPARGGAAG
jgi:MFS family permease